MTEKKLSSSPVSNIMPFVLICFFLSGITGLTYEILWTRMIVKLIGGAPFAISIILTVFMAGLGLGSYIAGRYIDQVKNHLNLVKIYGVLELVIGFYGLLLPLLIMAFKPLYAIVYNQLFNYFMLYSFLTFLGCALLLVIPVICMGATLPILCRFYVTSLSHLGTHTGRLYGLNTIGAAVGSLLCGFWLINLLGVWGTLIFAVLINCAIGIFCIIVGSRAGQGKDINTLEVNHSPPTAASENNEIEDNPRVLYGALVIFAVSGFCSMAYEVIWAKLLGLIVGPTTYSFTIVLVTFILGLALGSILFGWLADRFGKTIWILLFTQIVAALFVLGISQLLGNSQLFFAKLIFHFQDQFALRSFLKALALFVIMIVPTLCLGATFPLVGKIYTRSISKVGGSIGFAYAINTIGAVLGSFSAGFILIPFMGKENGLSFVVGFQLLTTLVIAAVIFIKGRKGALRLIPLAVPVVAGLILCTYFPEWNRQLLSLGKYHRFTEIKKNLKTYGWFEALFKGVKILSEKKGGELVYYGDGIGGFTTVLKYATPFEKYHYVMVNSGKADASTYGDMKTQTLSAHFPMLFHKDPKTVMVLGLASGITAGEVLHYPIDQLDVIDINDQVVKASDFFIPWNKDVLSDPRTNLIVQDGRAHLNLTKEKYDVIISEPSNPWMAGLAALFTEDFFSIAKDRLNEDGIYLQFIHAYQMDWETFAMVGRTFSHVFQNSLLVVTDPTGVGADFLLVGINGTKELNLEHAKEKISYAQKSDNIDLKDPRFLYKMISTEDLQRLYGRGYINRDSRPRLEFIAPKLIYSEDPSIINNIGSRKWLSAETRDIVRQVDADINLQIGYAAYSLSVYKPYPGMIDMARASEEQKRRFIGMMDLYYENNFLVPEDLKDNFLLKRIRLRQIESIQSRIDDLPEKMVSLAYLASLFSSEGMMDEAIDAHLKVLELNPHDANTHMNIGVALGKKGRLGEALVYLNKALEIDFGLEKIHGNLGNILLQKGDIDDAIFHLNEEMKDRPDVADINEDMGKAFLLKGDITQGIAYLKKALQINPNLPETQGNLGRVLIEQGMVEEGIMHLKKAVQAKPDWIIPMNFLARILATHENVLIREPDVAVRLAERASELAELKNPFVMDTLAAAYAAVGMFDDAVIAAEKAIALAESSGQNALAKKIQDRLNLYNAGQPYVEKTS